MKDRLRIIAIFFILVCCQSYGKIAATLILLTDLGYLVLISKELLKFKGNTLFFDKWIRVKYLVSESAILTLLLLLTIMVYTSKSSFSTTGSFNILDYLISISIAVIIMSEVFACGYLAFFQYRKYYKQYIKKEDENVEREIAKSKAKAKRKVNVSKKIFKDGDSSANTASTHRNLLASNRLSRQVSIKELDGVADKDIDVSVAGSSKSKMSRRRKFNKMTKNASRGKKRLNSLTPQGKDLLSQLRQDNSKPLGRTPNMDYPNDSQVSKHEVKIKSKRTKKRAQTINADSVKKKVRSSRKNKTKLEKNHS